MRRSWKLVPMEKSYSSHEETPSSYRRYLTPSTASHKLRHILEMKFLRLFLLLIICFGLETRAEPVLSNGVIARVNESIITKKDLDNRIFPDIGFLQRQYATRPAEFNQKLRELGERHLEELIEEQLILHEFKTAGFVLPDSYIEDLVSKDIESYGDRLTLTRTLQAQGLTFESYRDRVRKKAVIREMRRHNVPQDPLISPHKIELNYVQNKDNFKVEDQVKLRMIVVPNQPDVRPNSSKKLADEIVSKIREGVPFAEMARIYSQSSQSSEGGDWGWVERPVLRADLAERAFALKPGELSDVISASDGSYIMLVEGVRPAHIKSLPEVREEIESTLKADESQRLHRKWIDRLKGKSLVRYY